MPLYGEVVIVTERIGPALARFRDADGQVAGAGFLIAADLVVTCAHVIAADATAADPPAGPITVEFPLIPGAATAQGEVVSWTPVAADGTGDVAVLRVSPPDGATPVPIAPEDGVWGHPFRACGFPKRFDDGFWVTGVVRGRQATGWIQLEVAGRVEFGFSGAPVWDEAAGGVVGMLVARAGAGTAFLLPGSALGSLWRAVLPDPYRGLESFAEADAPLFHGRDADIERLLGYVRNRSLTLVVGPSGSGKSSLVKAGLLPLLRPDTHIHAAGADVEAALTDFEADEGDAVLFVDQFEEVVDTDPARAAALLGRITDLVGAQRKPRLRAVLTARSDSLDALLTSETAEALDHAVVFVGPLDRDGLRAAITEPVKSVGGVVFEDGLVDRVLSDAGTEPGRLPLVEFALTELWRSRHEGRLTHAAYDEIGGVSGALARYAERTLWFRVDDKDRVRRVLTRLARPDGAGGYTRRRIPLSDVDDHGLLATLADSRLVVVGEFVELTHQALAAQWPRLRDWLDADREFVTWRTELDQRREQWASSGRDPKSLLGGGVLARAQDWVARRGDELSEAERDYVARSVARQRRETRRWRAVTAVLAVVALVAAALFAVTQVQRDRIARQLVETEAALDARTSLQQVSDEPLASLRLALRAWRGSPGNSDAYAALLEHRFEWWDAERVEPGTAVRTAASADGAVIAFIHAEGHVTVWQGADRWQPSVEGAQAVAVSRDGRQVAVATTREVLVWRDRQGPVSLPGTAAGLRFDVEGGRLTGSPDRVAGFGEAVTVWDVARARVVATTTLRLERAVSVPGDRVLAIKDNHVVLLEVAGWSVVRDYPAGAAILGYGEAVGGCGTDRHLLLYGHTPDEDRTGPFGCLRGYPGVEATGEFLDVSMGGASSRFHWYLHWRSGRLYPVTFGVKPNLGAEVVGQVDDDGFHAWVVGSDSIFRVRAARPFTSPLVPKAMGRAVFRPDGSAWAGLTGDGVRLVDREGVELARAALPGPFEPPPNSTTLAFTPDGRRLLIGIGDNLYVLDDDLRLERAISLPGIRVPGSEPSAVPLSDDEVVVLYGGTLSRWRIDSGKPLGEQKLTDNPEALRFVAAKGHILPRPGKPDEVVLDATSAVEVWDVRQWRRMSRWDVDSSGAFPGGVATDGERTAVLRPGLREIELSDGKRITGENIERLIGFHGDLLLVQVESGLQVWRSDRMVAQVGFEGNLRDAWQIRDSTLSYVNHQPGPDGETGAESVRTLSLEPKDWYADLCRIVDGC